MIKGLYESALGMITQMHRMDVISNNLANADTIGYKKDIVSTSSFPEMLANRLHDKNNLNILNSKRIGGLSLGVRIDSIHIDYTQGNLKRTDSTFDIAINGSGFIAVDLAGQERYTRDGALKLNNNRVLMTSEGNIVKGVNGNTITVPDGIVSIDPKGNLFVNDEYINTIKLVSFDDKDLGKLRKTENNLIAAPTDIQTKPFTGTISQGFVEGSNVNTVREMVDMISVSRAYESNQKMIQTQDATLGRAVTEIAKK